MNLISHAFIGVMICEVFMLSPAPVIVGAVLPDMDYLAGIPHRTITHSLLFVAAASLIAWKLTDKRTAYSFFLGLSSHLILDSITPMGIPLLYPMNTYFSFNLVNSNDIIANLGFILLSIIAIINKDAIHDYLFSLKKGQALKGVTLFIVGWFVFLSFFQTKPLTIKDVLAMTDGSLVTTKGTVCSDITFYTSKSGNHYQIFDLCDSTGKIRVWSKLKNNLSKGELIQVNGFFTLKYKEPEINYAKVTE